MPLHDLDVLTGRNKRGGGAVSQRVQSDAGELGQLRDRRKARSAFRGSVGVPICVGNTKSPWPGDGGQAGAVSCSAASAVLCRRKGIAGISDLGPDFIRALVPNFQAGVCAILRR